ncbi:helix-turn-helix domain-containing protein [Neisseria chenwenguii]|uniref:helix-turn-helix domain-containing protein n=1 Tax=Neisseria chenwenguii TaxID=1853278 RepID=UPI000F4E0E3E|nr:helix-turn-helix transcriptional regulator [Neisseria chenwenguii]ROV57292.1 XRE family transcriptional regulator [Neisseria chenwenguii]
MKNHLNHTEINRQIGKAIAKYRQQSELTQEQVAELLELSNETVSRMERGMIMPNVMRLMELADIFGCSAADLLGKGNRVSEQSTYFANLMEGVGEEDRKLVLELIERLIQRLKQS